MKARYYKTGSSFAIYSDFDLTVEEDVLSDVFHRTEGVEKILFEKYTIVVTVGLLFDTDDVAKECLKVFDSIYGAYPIKLSLSDIPEKGSKAIDSLKWNELFDGEVGKA